MAKKFQSQEYSVSTNNKGLKEDTALSRFLMRFTVVFSTFSIIASVAIIAFAFIFILSPIMGTSMMSTLNATGENTDSVLTNKVADPERGDIIVTKLYGKDTRDGPYDTQTYPNKDENGNYMYVIKRLIALPGDKISMVKEGDSYYIYLNGEKLNEDYLDPIYGHPGSDNFKQLYNVLNGLWADTSNWIAYPISDCIENGVLTVPEGYWFYMGDNRGGHDEFIKSWDCTSFGPQKIEYYVGRCDKVVANETSVFDIVWDEVVYYAFFGWLWQN